MIERKSEVRLKQSNLDFSLKTLHNVYYSSASPPQLPHLYFLFENCSGRKWKPYRMYKRQKTLLFRTVSQNECETELRLSLREVCIERWKICYVNLQCNCFEMEILVMVHSWNKQIFRFCKPILYLIFHTQFTLWNKTNTLINPHVMASCCYHTSSKKLLIRWLN